ncbi:MAG TPA: glycosyltransferase family 2 protein [Chitinophagaceae bacterium]|jgi:glycosyltransferase involved in cell wall biosynthesis|nr:glycosyltransferase family 2 protein [Chitinophagaceae bacterium]
MIITVVIPCYNVSRHIEDVIKQLPYEVSWIIAVNDCSKDDTEKILLKLSEENKKIIFINHELNQGVGGAMITGFKRSLELNSDISIKIDGDNQMDSSYIPALIKPIVENKADYTKGNRFRDLKALRQMPVIRRTGNLGLSFCIKAASGYWNIFDPNNGFVAISNEMLKTININKIHKRYFFESSMLIELYHCEAVIQEIPMKAKYGDEVSHLSLTRALFGFPPKLLKAFIRRIILKYFLFDFNIASLYILFGFPLFIIGLIYGIVNFIEYGSSHTPAPTGTVVIPTLLIIMGFQLLLSATSFDISNYPKSKDTNNSKI